MIVPRQKTEADRHGPVFRHNHSSHYKDKEIIREDQVLKAMKEAGKPVRPGDIAKVLGVDSKEVSKACAELKKAGKIYSPKRCYYEPVKEA